MTTYPLPIGPTASFSPVAANTNTATFYMPPGMMIVTFNPADVNNPGVLTLYTSAGTSMMTMKEAGHFPFIVPGEDKVQTAGANYYFSCTQPMNLVGATVPTIRP